MDEQLKNVGKNIIEFWKKLSKKVKITIVAASSALVLGAIVLAFILNKTDYVVLFSNLEETEVSEVMAKLQEKNIEYKYETNGQILVPEKSEALLRMQLAQEGYPRSGLNYDVFSDNIDFMTTDYEKKTYMLFLRQERIQASIKTINGVKDSIVTLNIPDSNNFAWDANREETTASVKINLLPGYTLSKAQIQGIKRLVQTSVTGLKEENLAIIDTEGNDLLSNSDIFQTDTIKLKLEIQKQIQRDIENNIKKLLTRAFGKDNFEVSASCNINLDKKISEHLQYIPDKDSNKGVVRSEDNNVEIVGDGEVTGGVVGTETNSEVPIYPDVTIEGNNIYYKDNSSIEYLVSQIKEQIQHEPGNIENLSIAVIINRDRISEEESEKIKSIVANSAGTIVDNVALHNMKFNDPVIEVFDDNDNLRELTDREKIIIAVIGGAAFLVLIILMIIISRIRKKRRLKKEQELLMDAKGVSAETWADLKDEIEVKETKEIVLKKQISEFANTNPEIAAQLIRTWIKGEDD